MATEQDAIDGLEDLVNNLADNLGKTGAGANRLISKTYENGESETYSSLGDQLHALNKALELRDRIEAKKSGIGDIRFYKLTGN